MDAKTSTDTASIRPGRSKLPDIKDKRSKLLRAFVAEINKPHRKTAADRRFFEKLADPSNWREPVYS